MNDQLDLRQLAVRRDDHSPSIRRPRAWLTRIVLPGLVLLGFVALLGWSLREQFVSSQTVTVLPVLATRGDAQLEGTPLFQAAGWVEPRPTPVLVTALTEGVIDQLLVVEDQEVKPGQIIAKLNPAETKLAVKSAQADLALRKAELVSAKASYNAAKVNLEHPNLLQAAVAEAEAALGHKETHAATLPFQIKAAQSRAAVAKQNFDNKQSLSAMGAVGELQLAQAKSEHETALATLGELEAHYQRLRPELQALKDKQKAARQRLDYKTDEKRLVAEAAAQCQAAQARVDQAQTALDLAELRLERMEVCSPVAGRVLTLVARPGMRMMGLSNVSLHEASTVVTLYDPKNLQIRADVRLDDVPRVQPGMKVKIQTAAVHGGQLDGEVLFPTSQADIQKNTLQVKVAVHNPPASLRPDMLVQVTFQAPPAPKDTKAGATVTRLLIPSRLVETGDGGARVWLADQAAHTARLRTVKLGPTMGDWVEVKEGLRPGDRLIATGRENLRDGQRIVISGEE